ncbi:hypothetical protein PFTANZ_06234 [Plasmodium falciparum Tanzania (2000708)]|uniref:Duffy-binding-like domain-containing protein n=2 Tax=Plasmodium falciparum TaxID=5833 RepID=A0A024VXS6_PLAFA|nr:hypothetical protein PFTANZ_06234 [Plasmodium falciparum Tanzania (2000708)]
MNDGTNDGRNPCHRRNQNRFSENAEAYCSIDKIRDNGIKSSGGTCVPFRRQNICDKNLEFLDNDHTDDTDDLLGNVLVTAKYEGESIVSNHPHKETSDVCTALARSFADIGDIVRGKDMFKPNDADKVQKGLQVVFKKIYKSLSPEAKNHYKDDDISGNYSKLREDWWIANRDQVWRAITCKAPQDANYFRKGLDGSDVFTSQGQCGHSETNVPTNLDYVPQFLRWFEEWAEEFCRIKKIKLWKVKEACRGKKGEKYCSHNGYDCTQTIRNKDICIRESKCTDCSTKCKLYEICNINNEYYEIFYKQLIEKKYENYNDFLKLLNEGKYCKEKISGERNIDFTKSGDEKGTFYRSDYCQICPECGVQCSGTTCTPKTVIHPNCKDKETYEPGDAKTTDITVLYSADQEGDISNKLSEFCNGKNNKTGKNYQKWECYYKDSIDNKCKMVKNSGNNTSEEKITKFHNFFEMWVTYLLTETITWKDKLKTCMNNTKTADCIHECNKNCVCFDKWVKQKEDEWNSIKKLFTKEKKMPKQYYLNINYLFEFFFFLVMYKLKKEAKWKELMDELRNKIELSKEKEGTKDLQDAIELLLEYLKEKSTICKDNNTNEACESSKKSKTNPCANTTGAVRLAKSVTQLASEMQKKAKAQLGSDHISKLKANAKLGQYSQKGVESTLKTECDITNKHTNDSPPRRIRRGRQVVRRSVQVVKRRRSGHDLQRHQELQRVLLVGQEPVNGEGEEANGDTTVELPGPPVTPVPELPGPPATTPEVEPPCDIVEEHFKLKNNNTGGIDHCNPKNYNGWTCQTDKFENDHAGACMPPRRQKLCLINLQHLTEKTSDDLRKAFIKCAAAETYLLWKKYKEDKKKEQITGATKSADPDGELKSGTIPEDFKRQMFYTFGDYRDLCVGTDISASNKPVKTVKDNIKNVFNTNNGLVKGSDKEKRESFWNEHKEAIWEGMLCGLSHHIKGNDSDEAELQKFTDNNKYSTVSSDLEKFSQTPQFLRWFTEWSDEFCTEREEKEKTVVNGCINAKEYEGCNKANTKDNGKCVSACKDYEGYITKKKTQYDSQERKFKDDKTQRKPGYNDILNDDASDYLKKECINSSCDCIEKVKKIHDYWTNPHKTYNTEQLETKCQCPPLPCEIVDKTLGDKTSKSYADGCKWKYGKMPLGLGWLCNDKGKGGNEDGDVCIPPRRQKLYVYELETFNGKTQEDLRQAFIKCAAIETFFAWHEFKKEKEREYIEKQNLVYISSDDNAPQKKLEKGTIPEEFKRQMIYTFADYENIFFGKDTGSDADKLNQKIKNVFSNDKTSTGKKITPQVWWNTYAEDIWKGMLCALSYNTETKVKNEELHETLTNKSRSDSEYNYKKVTFKGGLKGEDTSLSDFVKRPPLFRWLEEWAHEFCTKRTYNLQKIEKECKGLNGKNNCDGDGFDCDEMCPKKDGSFETFYCLSCANSCRKYKKWIERKRIEYEKLEQKYKTAIENVESKYGNIYDNEFVKKLSNDHKSADSFLHGLKNGPCKNNNGGSNINFKEGETFEHAENCKPCSTIGFKCIGDDSSGVTENGCNGKTFNIKEHSKNTKNDSEEVGMLVSDNSTTEFAADLNEACEGADIFEGIKENKWECRKVCGLDICEHINSHGDKDDKPTLLIRALLKRWIETFLEDYNKINDKISHCMKNDKKSPCINGCQNKCNCVDKWITKKKEEWPKIRDRYVKQYSDNHLDYVYEVKRFLEGGPFHDDVQKAIKPSTDLNEFEKSTECTDSNSSAKGERKKKDVVECLLDKLQKEINGYQNQHTGTDETSCSEASPIPPNTLDIPPDIAPIFCNMPPNPCSDKNDTNIVSVTDVAQEIQKEVKKGMLERSVKKDEGASKAKVVVGKGKGNENDESVLRADASKGEYKRGAQGNTLNGDICNINTSHSNDSRGSNKGGPCTGKDNSHQMFKVENGWKSKHQINTPDDVFLPPRREHFCTSNVEHLYRSASGLQGTTASHSLLGDVLLAAKEQADFIKRKYDDKKKRNSFNDNATICRAIKYSFADIGDIIKGTDLWIDDGGEKKTQNRLKEIFDTIKNNLPDAEIKKQYEDHNDSEHKQLRKDWWEANRDQVWKVMTCPSTPPRGSNPHCGYSEHTPLDDYIPQKLRWMTEWAEWYCKVQSLEYEKLEKQCSSCKSNGKKCENGNPQCNTCKNACKEYEQKIKKWEEQWTKIKGKYEQLYQKATASGDASAKGSKDENVVEFLKILYEKNKDSNKIYATAAGYIHQELPNMECKEQTEFCNSSGRDKKNYAFEDYPKNYKERCNCTNAQDQKPTETTQKKACEIVKEILEGKDGKSKIHGCDPKTDEPYPKWDCEKNYTNEENKGICVPPRRRKLCTSDITKQERLKTKENIKREFIKSAAIENYFAWERYKKFNKEENSQLEKGTIPDDFLRSMKNTFADYKDIFFGKDISTYYYISDVSKRVISILKERNEKPDEWWKKHGKEIWEGMLCALTHEIDDEKKNLIKTAYSYENLKSPTNDTPSLDEFSSRPQFLRWFTEWGEEFCRTRGVKIKELEKGCEGYVCNGENMDQQKKKCEDACKVYQDWLKDWKTQYEKQSEKFTTDKEKPEYKDDPDVASSQNAYKYLSKKLKSICQNGSTTEKCDYNCMENASTQSLNNTDMPASLDEEPDEVKGRCKCPPPPPKPPGDGGAARILTTPRNGHTEEEEDSDESSSEDAEDDDDADDDDDDDDDDEDDEDDDEAEEEEEEDEDEVDGGDDHHQKKRKKCHPPQLCSTTPMLKPPSCLLPSCGVWVLVLRR